MRHLPLQGFASQFDREFEWQPRDLQLYHSGLEITSIPWSVLRGSHQTFPRIAPESSVECQSQGRQLQPLEGPAGLWSQGLSVRGQHGSELQTHLSYTSLRTSQRW